MMSSQSTVFISFQNGLGNEELIAELMGEDRVLGGLTAQGANIEVNIFIIISMTMSVKCCQGPGHIRAHTALTTWIGEMGGEASERVAELCGLFSDHGLPCEASSEIR